VAHLRESERVGYGPSLGGDLQCYPPEKVPATAAVPGIAGAGIADCREFPSRGGHLTAPPASLTDALHDRYTLERELGRGGMATVYLARDLKHDRLVALKVLRAELGAALGAARFQQEIGIAARLHHPLILPVFDSGASPGDAGPGSCLWYAMPFVEGESLRDRLRRERQLAIEEAVRIGCEVADALGYAHAHGVVHRDIKPENIMMSGDHALVADFGIARALSAVGEDRLTETGLSLGTPTYMSPEQTAGDDQVDRRSDLYSLGCVLYEMLAGQPPFTGANPQAILARHVLDPVPSLRTVRSNVPAGLEAAIRRALSKVPGDRFASAADLIEALKRGAARSSVESSPQLEVTRPVPKATAVPAASRPALTTPSIALVGRVEEWNCLMRVWLAAQRGPPRCVLVSGVAGIGKTRLVEEFVRWADQQGAAIATSRCYGTVGKLPYAPLADWLRSPPLRDSLSDLPEVWRGEIAGLLPEIGIQPLETGARRDVPQAEARRRLFEAMVRAIGGVPHPLVLFLDDIQWADRDTLEWIGYFLRIEDPRSVLVLATLRLGEVPLEDRLNAVLRDLRREGRMEEMPLEPLSAAETVALATAVAGATLDSAAAQRLHRETEGHPLYIVEMLRAKETGLDGPEPLAGNLSGERPVTGPKDRRSLPQRVLATIEARLAQLSSPARTIVGVAAVIGREFRLDLLAESGGISEDETASALDELLERRLVREQTGGSYDFSHDNIREVAYAGLGSARRRLLHHRIAQAQIASAAGSRSAAAGIAKHLEQGGYLPDAIPYYKLAAEHAVDLYAAADAIVHLDTAIELLKHLPASAASLALEIDLRTALCAALISPEGYSGPRILQEHTRIQSLCDQAGVIPAPPLLRSFAHPLILRAALSELEALGQQILAAIPQGGASILSVEAHYVLAVAAFWRGDPVDAAGHFQAALDAYRPENAREHIKTYGQDPAAVCGVRLGYALGMIDRPVEARDALEHGLAWAESLAHPHSLAYAGTWGTYAFILLGDEAGARRVLDGAKELAEANAFSHWSLMNQALDGFLLAREGQVDRGIELMKRAAEEWAGRGFKLAVPQNRAFLAEICLGAGRLEEGFAALDEGAATSRETGMAYCDAELLRLRGELLAASGAPTAEVRRVLQEAIDVATRQGATALVHRAERSLHCLIH
jgi:tetratricopeptide (TPR) repeat protein